MCRVAARHGIRQCDAASCLSMSSSLACLKCVITPTVPGRGESIAAADQKVGHAMCDHSCGPRAAADRARGRANKDRTFS